jgi:transposase
MALVLLSDRQRAELEELVAHTPLAKERCRAQALLWIAEGSDVGEVAELLHVSRQTIYNWRSRFQERAEPDLRAGLLDAPRLGRPRAASGTIDDLVAAVIDGDPRDLGYHATVWTAPLLCRYLHDHQGIEVSDRTVGRAIDRLDLSWKRPRHELARRLPTWRQSKGGSKRGLDQKERSVLLMLDETIITETPPLYNAYGHVGEQVRVPITGNRAKRFVHGAIHIASGDVVLLITEEWVNETSQAFLAMVRSHWRGWNPVLFEDRASQHTSSSSLALAFDLGIEVRLLPRATPELNAMDHLWRPADSALAVCQYIIDLSPRERLRQAGVLSGHFWLTTSGNQIVTPRA